MKEQDLDIIEYERVNSRLAELEKELELKRQHVSHLEGVLNEVLPLRRHFKRQVKAKLKNANSSIILALKKHKSYVPAEFEHSSTSTIDSLLKSDRMSFIEYNKSSKTPTRLRLYLKLTSLLIRVSSKLLRISKV